jgi:hypothetical protein
MGDDVDVKPEEALATARQLREHAGEIEAHGRALEAATQGRVGHGPIGEVIDELVKRGLRAVSHGVTGAVKKLHEDTALGLEKVVERTREADARAKSAFEDLEHRPHGEVGSRTGVATGGGGEEATGGAIGDVMGHVGWEKDGRALSPEANAKVDAFLSRAAEVEPKLTAKMQELKERLRQRVPGTELTGLEYRLKEADSLKGKVARDLKEQPDLLVDRELTRIKDSVRYTLKIPDRGYVDAVNAGVAELKARDYENVSWKPSWPQDGYKGINSTWRDPATGHLFELQFHTPASFDAKMETHDFYKQIQLPSTPSDVRLEVVERQNEIFARVPIPPGLDRLVGP